MKRPTPASLKRVNAENLARLGAERLAELLATAADARPDLKRRLRMELAAEQGAEHLALEIDRRLGSLESSRGKVSWRQRPTFVRDLDTLRGLIVGRLAPLDAPGALGRMWLFLDIARRVGLRVRDRDGAMAAVFRQAGSDIGDLLGKADPQAGADALVDSLVRNPLGWADWLPALLEKAPPGLAATALRRLSQRDDATPGWMLLIRQLADAAGDVDAFAATYGETARQNPSIAAEIGQRLLAAGRIEEAGQALQAGRAKAVPFEWESAWIDYLERAGQAQAAQDARWAAFERTLSAERARAFTQRLTGFDDVEAESRAFEFAASHRDFERGLEFLMNWPALPEAARMIQAREGDIRLSAANAELWAARLRPRQPAAAHLLLRKAAAAAFQRRELATCERLTQEADAIEL